MHPVYGVHQLHHNQLNITTKHLQDIKQDVNLQQDINNNDNNHPIVKKFTRRKL